MAFHRIKDKTPNILAAFNRGKEDFKRGRSKSPYQKTKREYIAWLNGYRFAAKWNTDNVIVLVAPQGKDHPVKRTLDMRDHDLMMEINDKIQNKKIKRRIKIKESSDQKLEAKKNMIAFTRKLKENRERVERDRREKEKGVA